MAPKIEEATKRAEVEAQERILREAVTTMPAEQFDELMSSLEAPDHAPNLAEASRTARRFKHA